MDVEDTIIKLVSNPITVLELSNPLQVSQHNYILTD
jgi:hypothetical protein